MKNLVIVTAPVFAGLALLSMYVLAHTIAYLAYFTYTL